jgi:hypothetical protein
MRTIHGASLSRRTAANVKQLEGLPIVSLTSGGAGG